MTKITESDIENFAIELLEKQGYTYLSAEQQGRENLVDVVLRSRLKNAIDKLVLLGKLWVEVEFSTVKQD